jgi:hypothetical protein
VSRCCHVRRLSPCCRCNSATCIISTGGFHNIQGGKKVLFCVASANKLKRYWCTFVSLWIPLITYKFFSLVAWRGERIGIMQIVRNVNAFTSRENNSRVVKQIPVR